MGCSVFLFTKTPFVMMQRLCTRFLIMLCSVLFLPHAGFSQDSTLFFIETFDAVSPPTLPAGWSDATLAWETSSSVASTGSGVNNAKITGTAAGTLLSAPADLTGLTSGNLQYLARRTSSYAQEAMRVLATLDGGVTFITVLDDGTALPLDDGSYALIDVVLPASVLGMSNVQFAFEALGGITSGANVRLDDVVILGTGTPAATESALGFAEAASTVDAAGVFEVPVLLDFDNADLLQGIQLDISWTEGMFTLTDVARGDAITDTSAWAVNFESRDGELRIVVLGDPATSLSSGLYDPLLTLKFTVDPANTADDAVLSLDRVVGALAVRAGTDAGIATGLATHTVTFATGSPAFTPDAVNLDVGIAPVDSLATAALLVTNTGTAPLVIDSVGISNLLFSIDADTVTLGAGASRSFSLSFSPSFDSFGAQTGQFTFYHNASGGSDVIQVTGLGTGGRGDASQDGLVDASDLVLAIDAVLERTTLTESGLRSADQYPYELPDGLLDVRDLTVLSQAIVLGSWPDETDLPATTDQRLTSAKNGEPIYLQQETKHGITTLYLQTTIPLRAFQLAVDGLWGEKATTYDDLQQAGVSLQIAARSEDVNMLGVRYDGNTIAPGTYALVSYPDAQGSGETGLGYALAISATGERLPIRVEVQDVQNEAPSGIPEMVVLGQPYPNPFDRTQHPRLGVPFKLGSSQHVRIEVYDLLGRSIATLVDAHFAVGEHLVEWGGDSTAPDGPASGLYMLQIQTAEARAARMVVVY